MTTLEEIPAKYGVPDAGLVGKLPRVTCRACSDAKPRGHCDRHEKRECKVCGNWITTAHLHLDYMGHAEVTRALIEIDPAWSWEPCAWDADGGPAIRVVGGTAELWGKLTLLGHTRIGVGSVEARAFDVGKQLIGDFLRNAAMRFGIALSLWSKSEWEHDADETAPADGEVQEMVVDPNGPPVPAGPVQTSSANLRAEVSKAQNRLDAKRKVDLRDWRNEQGIPHVVSQMTDEQLRAVAERLGITLEDESNDDAG